MRSRKRHQSDDSPQPAESSPPTGMSNHVATQPLLLTLPQVAQQLGLSQAKVYPLVELEGLPIIKIGRCTRVLYGSLVRWVKEREQRA